MNTELIDGWKYKVKRLEKRIAHLEKSLKTKDPRSNNSLKVLEQIHNKKLELRNLKELIANPSLNNKKRKGILIVLENEDRDEDY